MTSISYHVISPVGSLGRTFDTAEAARRYVLQHKHDLPGLMVEEVTTTVSRRRVYTPRTANRSAA